MEPSTHAGRSGSAGEEQDGGVRVTAADGARTPSRLTWTARTVVALELLLALAAVGGGTMMVLGPDGELIGMSPSYLDKTPFRDLVVPGIALIVVNGVLPLTVAIMALMRRPHAALGHVAVGMTVLGWIALQFVIMGYQAPVQIIVLVWGVAILALALLNYRRADQA